MNPQAPSLAKAFRDALAARKDVPANPAVEALAVAYATEIDQAEDRAKALEVLGPKLLAALAALGMTVGQTSNIAPGRLTTTAAGPAGAVDTLSRMREQRRGSA